MNLGTKEGYTRSEIGRDMIRVFDETGVELQVHWGKDNDKHNNSTNYYKKGTPINLSKGNLVKDINGNQLFTIKFSKDSGHSEFFDTDSQETIDSSFINGIEVYHLKVSENPTTLEELNALGDVVNIEMMGNLWSFKKQYI